jgi:hypothetical protein
MAPYLADEQKGARKGSRGTKDQLLIDKAITRDSKTHRKNLAMAWIDYQKAYDSVPHSWIIESLKLYKVSTTLVQFIEESMKLWQTELTCAGESLGNVRIKRGIFQGDALSPLLFCIALNPLSELLRNGRQGYTMKSGQTISHLLYMDDLKLYGRNQREIDSQINTVRIFSEDIGMKFGLDKCARLIINRGKVQHTEGIELPEGRIEDLKQGYKYLGILQIHEAEQLKVKARVKKELYKRTRKVLESNLNGRNKMTAINTFALPVITYTAGTIDWRRTELQEMDGRIRKLLTMHGGLNPKADIDRLYVKRKKGGRGLISIESAVDREVNALRRYITTTSEPMLKEAQQHRVLPASKEQVDRESIWKEKVMHGQFARQLQKEEINEAGSHRWLTTSSLNIQTEALITAAQDQALNTKYHRAKIHKENIDTRCRVCNEADETVNHIVSGCGKMAQTAYLRRHNKVAAIAHWQIAKNEGLDVPADWWKETPQPVMENENVKLLWDFDIQTDRTITARRPDIVVQYKRTGETSLIDIAVPADHNVKDKELEKIQKYGELRLEIERLWKTKARVVPIVVGALGTTSRKFEDWLEMVGISSQRNALQRQALYGTATILRQTLGLPESR